MKYIISILGLMIGFYSIHQTFDKKKMSIKKFYIFCVVGFVLWFVFWFIV